MATTTTVTLGGLIEDTLSILYRLSERPHQVTVGADALANAADTQLTVSSGDRLQMTDVVELGDELCLVTAKSSDSTPVFTVARGYAGTTASSGHSTGTTALINPPWPRFDIASYLRRCVSSLLNSQLPSTTTASMNTEADKQYVVMPADTMRVLSVRHMIGETGRIMDVGGWQFEQDLPTSIVSTGKALRTPTSVDNLDDLIVMYQSPYEWSGTGEDASLSMPIGSEDIPPLWAAAYAVTRREVTRIDLDRIEEWNHEAAMRQGVNLRWARELWGEVYRRVDEAKSMQYIPKYRPFRKIPTLL